MGDGATRREHLQSVERQTGKAPSELRPPPFPGAAAEVWSWFVDLDSARQGGFGPTALSYNEIRSYFELMDIQPNRWELHVIRQLDIAAVEAMVKDQATKTKGK
jgi:hypothetical protein